MKWYTERPAMINENEMVAVRDSWAQETDSNVFSLWGKYHG